MHDTMTQPATDETLAAHAGPTGPGEPAAAPLELGELLRQFYTDLRRLARSRTRRLPAWRTLCTTGLVHEAFLRLQQRDRRAWATRSHFFADVAVVMRDIAVDYLRSKQAAFVVSGNDAPLDAGSLSTVPRVQRSARGCACDASSSSNLGQAWGIAFLFGLLLIMLKRGRRDTAASRMSR